MIRGRHRLYRTKCKGELQRVVVVVRNETVDPVAVAAGYVDDVKPGWVRVWTRVKVRRSGTACGIQVFDKRK